MAKFKRKQVTRVDAMQWSERFNLEAIAGNIWFLDGIRAKFILLTGNKSTCNGELISDTDWIVYTAEGTYCVMSEVNFKATFAPE